MTTREVYFKCLMLTELPIGIIGYIYKDDDNVIQICSNIRVELRTDEVIVEKSINMMKHIEGSSTVQNNLEEY